jgi:hypothetical protein
MRVAMAMGDHMQLKVFSSFSNAKGGLGVARWLSHIGNDLAVSLCVMRCCVFSCRVFLSPFLAIEEQLHSTQAEAAELCQANDDLA